MASLTAPIAIGAHTADTQVKKRMTPAAAPCSVLGTQLMPFELSVGYTTDMKMPESGSRYTAQSTPPVTLRTKHSRMLPLDTASAVCQRRRVSIQAPRKRPAARSRKKTEMLYAASDAAAP